MKEARARKKPQSVDIDRRLVAVSLLALPLLVWVLYGGALSAPFVFDDRAHIIENPLIRAFAAALNFPAMRAVFDQPAGLAGRPLLLLTYGFNYAVSGSDAGAFRFTNLIIHTINAFLVFLIVWQLGGVAALQPRARFQVSLAAALIFASHPLLTESVTYVTGRSSSLCASFYFCGLLCTLYAGRVQEARRFVLLLIAALCAGIGWLVKQEAVTLPAAGMALMWLAWPAQVSLKTRLLSAVIPTLTTLGLLAVQAQPIKEMSVVTETNQPLVAAGFEATLPFKDYVLTSVKEYGAYYLRRFIVPAPLSVDPEPVVVRSPFAASFIIVVLLLAAMAAAVFWTRRRRPLVSAGIALILVSPLSAYCLFPLADPIAEHRAYISFLGAAIVIADALRGRAGIAVGAALLIAYSWLTIERNKVWADERLLWQDASRQAAEKIRPHVNLGSAYQVRGQTEQAIREYEFVLKRAPDHAASLSNLGSLYLQTGDLAKAEDVLGRAIAGQTAFPAVYTNLAVVRMRQSRLPEAKQLLQRSAALDARQALVHHNLADILLNEGKPKEAIVEYLAEIRINPDFSLTHLHLGLAYEAAGMPEAAKEQYGIALRLNPGDSEAKAALDRLQ